MNGILKVTKYQLRDFRKAVSIFYLVILILSTIWGISIINNNVTGQSNFTGGTFIFIFILGLNCFKNNFKFMSANNISRRRFYFGNIIAIIYISLFMATIDSALTKILFQVNHFSMYQQIYNNSSFFGELLWSFASLVFATSLGWVITMLYYRANNIMKIIISIMPVFFIIIFSYINSFYHGKVLSSLISFLGKIFGVTGEVNPYNAVLSFVIGTIGLFVISYLLIRRAPIKD